MYYHCTIPLGFGHSLTYSRSRVGKNGLMAYQDHHQMLAVFKLKTRIDSFPSVQYSEADFQIH